MRSHPANLSTITHKYTIMQTIGQLFIIILGLFLGLMLYYLIPEAIRQVRREIRQARRENHFRNYVIIILLIMAGATAQAQTVGQMLVAGGLMYTSGYADGVAETLQFNYSGYRERHPNTDPTWSNPDISWRNKWKHGNPDNGPAFWGSTHILVGTTDAYHLANTIRNTSATASFIVYGLPQYTQQEGHWWQKTWAQWIDGKRAKADPCRKPFLAYVAEFGFLTACRGAGFTTSYNWVYGGN